MASKNANTDERAHYKNKARAKRSKPVNRSYTEKGKNEKVMDKKPGGNDPRWWGPADYTAAVGKFNFSSPLGKAVPWNYSNDPNGGLVVSNATGTAASIFIDTIPGIMAIDVLPVMGLADSSIDPVNQYIRSVFTKLRSTNNQAAPYQAPDLGMYIMAIDSVHMGIEQLIRMYGIARTYSAMNRYMPTALLKAMGINPTGSTAASLYANLADFRAQILNLMIKIQTLSIPKGVAINERHRELVKYVYKDGESAKAQMYLFRTPYLYKYNETYSDNGGGLNAVSAPVGGSWSDWVTFVDDLINQLTASQFFANVSGDIIKSFGYENLYTMPFFDEVYTVAPVYNPEILLEIHNLTVCGDRFSDTAFDITQDAGSNTLICHPYFTTGSSAPAGVIFPLIDVPVDDPNPDMVMVATRLAVTGYAGYDSAAAKFKFNPHMLGTEAVTKLTIYHYNAAGTLQAKSTTSNVMDNYASFTEFIVYELFFDWHPHAWYLTRSTTGDTASFHSIISELQNYTIMSPGDLQKLHEMAVYGALTMVNVENVGLK